MDETPDGAAPELLKFDPSATEPIPLAGRLLPGSSLMGTTWMSKTRFHKQKYKKRNKKWWTNVMLTLWWPVMVANTGRHRVGAGHRGRCVVLPHAIRKSACEGSGIHPHRHRNRGTAVSTPCKVPEIIFKYFFNSFNYVFVQCQCLKNCNLLYLQKKIFFSLQ